MRLLFLSLAAVLVLVSTAGLSFAQTAGPSQSVLGIYAQVVVYDSSGNLVAYLETSRATILDTVQFNALVNQNIGQFTRTVASAGGQEIEILKANETVVHPYASIISENLISLNTPDGPKTLVFAEHDGYPVEKGDRVTTYWTIVRTAS
ncbi:MAG: hypothetical protein KGI27_07880 [Thaumarchaeota archaeon]|nr:hypothetical protein [Nitrososphaerota archaeon]